jgi:outer membrane immunogenic protein
MTYACATIGEKRFGKAGRRTVLGLLTLVSTTIGADQALAQDDDFFTGPRVELILGYDNSGINLDDDVAGGDDTSTNGFMYAVGAGYDYQIGGAVIGVEGEIGNTSAKKDREIVGPTTEGPIDAEASFSGGGEFYVGARVGIVVTPRTLLYVKAGYSWFKVDLDAEGFVGATPIDIDDGMSVDGYRLGIGAEHGFTDSIFGKIEYRYSNYNNGDFDVNGADADLDALFDAIDVRRHQAVVGVGLRF